jgi:serine/threonine protein phosphatase PrpC
MSSGYVHFKALASSRDKAQDRVEAFERDDTLVIVVTDGAGGIRGGVAASHAVVEAVRASVADPAFALDETRPWEELFGVTDVPLVANKVGETSALVVSLGPRRIVGVSAGDSEAWVVTAAQVDDLTQSQHTKRRLGSGRASPVTFERRALDGVLLVATDGLFKYASKEVIARIVRTHALGRAMEELVALVRLPSGRFAEDVAIVIAGQAPITGYSRRMQPRRGVSGRARLVFRLDDAVVCGQSCPAGRGNTSGSNVK